MKNYKVMDGNEACSHVAYMFTEVAGIYPITPASPMAEHVDEWSSQGRKNLFGDKVKVVEMQSEAGAAGMVHGSLQSGVLTTTFTASQGLLLMTPNMYKISGELLPGVIHVAARSIATHALSIFCDHSDVYATRGTGFAVLASSSVQQVMDLSGIAHLSSIKSSIPFLHFFDGFRTSHELQKIEVLDEVFFKSLLDMDKVNQFRNKALVNNTVTRGTSQSDDIFFQATEVRNKYYLDVIDIVDNYMKLVSEKTGREYKPFNYYGSAGAKKIIVAMGSVCETIKETIDYLNDNGESVGLIEVHLYRPLSPKHFLDVLPNTVEKIAVLDRTKEPGSNGEPLYLDVISIFNDFDTGPLILGGRYGLSSKDVDPSQIKAVYDFLDKEDNFNGFTVGIKDDVTNLSLEINDLVIEKDNLIELLIYGYGSDGMTSASKSLIKIMGSNSDAFVQGYFQYDSKKSRGLTRTHLRLSQEEIKSTHYVNQPHLIACTEELYLNDFDMLENIRKNGVFLLNSSKNIEDVKKMLSNNVKRRLMEQNIRFYIVNASELARKEGLGTKVGTIMESAIFKLTSVIDYEKAKASMKESAAKTYCHKGQKIIDANVKVIDEAENYIQKVELEIEWRGLEVEDETANRKDFIGNVIDPMNKLKGDLIPVSAFTDFPDGTFEAGTTKLEKRAVADFIPSWIPDNCIECGQCSLVCPHGAIRPFLLDEEEVKNAPDSVKKKLKPATGPNMERYKYVIGISGKDCTGCNLCVNTCPSLKKALEMKSYEEQVEATKAGEYLFNNVTDKGLFKPFSIKGSQFKKPLFEFSGACAGCGETPYLKLLTQLFGDRLVVANATGCSSIYGASAPSTPYSVPWANSLFEDNAEYGYGMLIGINTIRNRIKNIMELSINSVDEETKTLFNEWISNIEDYDISKKISNKLKDKELPDELNKLKKYIAKKSIWTVGGDGWAYDIGYGGLDHVLSTSDNVNVLVLDSQVYSNTGGQSSKASPLGSIAKFTASGKKSIKKDLAKIAMCYPHVYVAQISLGANMQQTIKALKEAEEYDGPSIIIAYTPCIAHGIKGGMTNSIDREKLATECGYWPIFRYDPRTPQFNIDCVEPNFELYENFLQQETRYSMLELVNKEHAKELLEQNKKASIDRWKYYKSIQKKEDN